ncbi:hypothetical protein LTR56_011012 [Elasticomyces elasticus]|nr:hypothetical protein LTR22_019598 [Elasticomyces elasticus]KAK3641911.1 hypothetical protein LTR56_011012 [Elasticomyces elasticus]
MAAADQRQAVDINTCMKRSRTTANRYNEILSVRARLGQAAASIPLATIPDGYDWSTQQVSKQISARINTELESLQRLHIHLTVAKSCDVDTAAADHTLTNTKAANLPHRSLNAVPRVPNDVRTLINTTLRTRIDQDPTQTNTVKHSTNAHRILQRTTPAKPHLPTPLTKRPAKSIDEGVMDLKRQAIADPSISTEQIPCARIYHPLPQRPDFPNQEVALRQTNAVPYSPLRSDCDLDSLRQGSNSLSLAPSIFTPAAHPKSQKVGKDLQDLAVSIDQVSRTPVRPSRLTQQEKHALMMSRLQSRDALQQILAGEVVAVGDELLYTLNKSAAAGDGSDHVYVNMHHSLLPIDPPATSRLSSDDELILRQLEPFDTPQQTEAAGFHTEQESVSQPQLTEAADFDAKQESLGQPQLTEAADFDAEQESLGQPQLTEAADFDAEQESLGQPQLTEATDFDAEHKSTSQHQLTEYDVYDEYHDHEFFGRDLEEEIYDEHQPTQDLAEEAYGQHQDPRQPTQDLAEEAYGQHQDPRQPTQDFEDEMYGQHQDPRQPTQDFEDEMYNQYLSYRHLRQLAQDGDVSDLDAGYDDEGCYSESATSDSSGTTFDLYPPGQPRDIEDSADATLPWSTSPVRASVRDDETFEPIIGKPVLGTRSPSVVLQSQELLAVSTLDKGKGKAVHATGFSLDAWIRGAREAHLAGNKSSVPRAVDLYQRASFDCRMYLATHPQSKQRAKQFVWSILTMLKYNLPTVHEIGFDDFNRDTIDEILADLGHFPLFWETDNAISSGAVNLLRQSQGLPPLNPSSLRNSNTILTFPLHQAGLCICGSIHVPWQGIIQQFRIGCGLFERYPDGGEISHLHGVACMIDPASYTMESSVNNVSRQPCHANTAHGGCLHNPPCTTVPNPFNYLLAKTIALRTIFNQSLHDDVTHVCPVCTTEIRGSTRAWVVHINLHPTDPVSQISAEFERFCVAKTTSVDMMTSSAATRHHKYHMTGTRFQSRDCTPMHNTTTA